MELLRERYALLTLEFMTERLAANGLLIGWVTGD